MSGPTELVLDTNALISLLQNEPGVRAVVGRAKSVSISIISAMEFLALPSLSAADEALFREALLNVNVVPIQDLSGELVAHAVEIRKQRWLKLPDAIIAATAMSQRAAVVTRDQQFSRVEGLHVVSF